MAEPLTLDRDRVHVILSATWEADALLRVALGIVEDLRRKADATDTAPHYALRGLIARLSQLNDSVMSLDDEHLQTARLHKTVIDAGMCLH